MRTPMKACTQHRALGLSNRTTMKSIPVCRRPSSVVVRAFNRRDLLSHAVTWSTLMSANVAHAGLPLDWGLFVAPQPVRFPRKPVDQRFAVLLMRASYDAADELDFMPMENFQVMFWKFRQGEQESYNLQYSPLKPRLGDLTDPLYFDFISFSQFAVIGREIPKGVQVFKEFCEECPDQKKVVVRDPRFADNSLLPERFRRSVGDKIYSGLLNGFREEMFGAPAPVASNADLQQTAAAVQLLLDSMVKAGYALKAVVTASGDGASFRVDLQGPLNLWGVAALKYRNSPVVNSYDIFVIEAFLRASGKAASCEASYSDVGVDQVWTLSA